MRMEDANTIRVVYTIKDYAKAVEDDPNFPDQFDTISYTSDRNVVLEKEARPHTERNDYSFLNIEEEETREERRKKRLRIDAVKHDSSCVCVKCLEQMERELHVDLDEWLAFDMNLHAPNDKDLSDMALSMRTGAVTANSIGIIASTDSALQDNVDNNPPIDEESQGMVSSSHSLGTESSHVIRGIVEETSHALRETVTYRGLGSHLEQSNISRTRQVENAVNSSWNPFGHRVDAITTQVKPR
jgi:hypothetical protein